MNTAPQPDSIPLKWKTESSTTRRSWTDRPIYRLLYPNMSEQVIFGASGEVVTIKGDARNLKHAEVYGSEENEAMTAFRMANMDKSTKEIRDAAAGFIAESPASPSVPFYSSNTSCCRMPECLPRR